MSFNNRVNDAIKADPVLVIFPDGTKKKDTPLRQAKYLASEQGLDLVQVSENPPVCKIIDYGKIKYDQRKKAKENAKKNPHHTEKEIRISYGIAQHDINIKNKKVKEFIDKGFHVKYSMLLRGRQRNMKKEAVEHFKNAIEPLKEFAEVKEIKVNGNNIFTNVVPK